MKILLSYSMLGCFIIAASVGYAQKNARTTSPTHNLVAIAKYTSDGTSYKNPADSTIYSYSGNRTGAAYPTLNGWNYAGAYDTAITYVYSTGAYTPYMRSLQVFDANENILSQITQSYSDTVAGNWLNEYRYEYAYDAHNNMLAKKSSAWMTISGGTETWGYYDMYGYVYDTSNNMISDTFYFADPTRWRANNARTYFYDAHHNVTEELISRAPAGTWDTTSIINYWLNAGFKPDSTTTFTKSSASGWEHSSTEKYTYDAGYNVLSDTLATLFYGVMTPHNLTINTYTGGNLATQESRINQAYMIPPVWTNLNYNMMGYDAGNNMISVIKQMWNPGYLSYTNTNKDTNTFSSFNKITSYATTYWNIVTKQWVQALGTDTQTRFYYDTIPGLYVNNAIEDATSISMYPVPANNNMKLSVNRSGSHNIVFDVYDMASRLYRQWSVNMTDNYSTDIPTAILPGGNYILTVKSDRGTMAKQFTVVH